VHDLGSPPEALALLQRSHERFPADRDTLAALVAFAREAGDADLARAYAHRLQELAPGDPQVREMVRQLEQ